MIYSREEFASEVRSWFADELTSIEDQVCKNHPIWDAEKMFTPRIHCNFFIKIAPIINVAPDSDFWYYMSSTLTGQAACFMSSSDGEWWGFSDESDITIFLLKWSY